MACCAHPGEACECGREAAGGRAECGDAGVVVLCCVVSWVCNVFGSLLCWVYDHGPWSGVFRCVEATLIVEGEREGEGGREI